MSRRNSLDVSEKSVFPTGNRKTIPREGPKNPRTASITMAGVLGEFLTGQLETLPLELTSSSNTLD